MKFRTHPESHINNLDSAPSCSNLSCRSFIMNQNILYTSHNQRSLTRCVAALLAACSLTLSSIKLLPSTQTSLRSLDFCEKHRNNKNNIWINSWFASVSFVLHICLFGFDQMVNKIDVRDFRWYNYTITQTHKQRDGLVWVTAAGSASHSLALLRGLSDRVPCINKTRALMISFTITATCNYHHNDLPFICFHSDVKNSL